MSIKQALPNWIPQNLYEDLNDLTLSAGFEKAKPALFRLDTGKFMPETWVNLGLACKGDFNEFLRDLFRCIVIARNISSYAGELDSPAVNARKMRRIAGKSKELSDLLGDSGQTRAVSELWGNSLVHGILHAKDDVSGSLWDQLSVEDRKKWALVIRSKLTDSFIFNSLVSSADMLASDSQINVEQGVIKPASASWRVSLIPALKAAIENHISDSSIKEFCSIIAALLDDDSYDPNHYLVYWRDSVRQYIKRSK